jgi:hypothetical protein
VDNDNPALLLPTSSSDGGLTQTIRNANMLIEITKPIHGRGLGGRWEGLKCIIGKISLRMLLICTFDSFFHH